MTMTTTGAAKAFTPDQILALVVQPVQALSVATQAANPIFAPAGPEFRVPMVTKDPTAEWTGEGEEITSSDATLEEFVGRFGKLAGLTIISRELADDSSPAASEIVGQGLSRDLARKLDAAFFGTKGSSTVQPPGLEDLEGVTEVDGGAAWTDTDPFVEAIYKAAGVGATLSAFVANPDDALVLATLKESTTSKRPLLGSDPSQPAQRQVSGVALLTSPAVELGTVWGVPKDRVLVVVRDDVKLDIDRSAYFSSDRVGIRATFRVAFAYPHPAAVVRIKLTTTP